MKKNITIILCYFLIFLPIFATKEYLLRHSLATCYGVMRDGDAKILLILYYTLGLTAGYFGIKEHLKLKKVKENLRKRKLLTRNLFF